MLAAVLIGPALVGSAYAQVLSVPPAAPVRPALTPKRAAELLLLPDNSPTRRIVLAAPTAAETNRMKTRSAPATAGQKGTARGLRAAVGFARALPAADQVLPLSSLAWQDVGGGMRAARITIDSPGARGLRIGVALPGAPPGLTLRFSGSTPGATVYGPVDAASIAADDLYWSPLLDGDTAVVELAVPQGVALAGAAIRLPMLSHLLVASANLKQKDPLSLIGSSQSCEVDVVCIAAPLQQQATTAINATARILLVDQGDSFVCSGTLLNDSITSLTPYFYTANHCIDALALDDPAVSKGRPAAVAQSFQTYWLFQTNACGADTSANVNFIELTSGTTLLARSVDYDWALVRLNEPAPAGTTFAAWNAAGPLATGTAADGIHHPEGDLKKFSQGIVQPYDTFPDGSSFIMMRWTKGVTEPGSSGSGLFTMNAAQTFLELRGGLWAGDSACTNQSGTDDYSRFDVALPLLAQYLTPNAANTTRTTPAVEFYNAALDDYFVTASPGEISDLDHGVHKGWVRSGLRFLVYTDPSVAPAGVQPVCRFYVAPAFGDSHFYSASPAECAATAQKFAAQWVYESAAVFYILLPDAVTGTCPAGSKGIFRFVNNANGLHHRYTEEVDVRDSTIQDGGWTQEGYGTPPDAPVMCSPTT